MAALDPALQQTKQESNTEVHHDGEQDAVEAVQAKLQVQLSYPSEDHGPRECNAKRLLQVEIYVKN